ncbi:hypothetical protein L218DRAFT_863785 [Marasmius fiardii PR-910]|nr:hypothetical protein L218DRAFT_863785 [Marasmius fiardii PR-910]
MISSKWLVIISSFLFNLGVMMPLTGLLVRWRAHFSPKRVRSERSGEEHSIAIKSSVMGYFTILRRVYNFEGVQGFYKGIGPLLLSFALLHLVIRFHTLNGSEPPPRQPGRSIMFNPDIHYSKHVSRWLLQLVINVPTQVIVNRATITPYRLSFTSPLKSLAVLLSPSELRNPSNLYFIPGFFLARFLLLFSSIAVDPIISLLVPGYEPGTPGQGSARALIPFFLFAVLHSIIETPLMVVSVRLSLQRYGGDTPENEGLDTTLQRYSMEDIITMKDTHRHPYTGLVDCLDTIIKEEGWKTLFRSGWLTFLGI